MVLAAVLKSNQITTTSNNNNTRKKSFNSNNNHIVVDNSKTQHILNQHLLLQQRQASTSPPHDGGEQPAKFLKVVNGVNGGGEEGLLQLDGQKINLIASEGFGGITSSNGKIITNGNGSLGSPSSSSAAANELCRLPGGAELNILPPTMGSSNIISATTSNGLKANGTIGNSLGSAFYHANGKITFFNGTANTTTSPCGGVSSANGILLKDSTSNNVVTSVLIAASSGGATSPCITTTANLSSLSHQGLHFAGNFAQLLAAANSSTAAVSSLSTSAPHCSPVSVGGFALNGGVSAISNGTLNVSSLSLSTNSLPQHMTASSQSSVELPKTKNNSKASIVGWRSGAATTIN